MQYCPDGCMLIIMSMNGTFSKSALLWYWHWFLVGLRHQSVRAPMYISIQAQLGNIRNLRPWPRGMCTPNHVLQLACLGVTDNEKTNMCSFHAGDAEDKCSFLESAEAHQTLYMKGKDNRDGVSVGYSYIPNLPNPCCISIPNTSLDSINWF